MPPDFDDDRRGQALRRAEAAGDVGVWSIDLEAGDLFANPAAEHLLERLGLRVADLADPPRLLDRVEPDDRPLLDNLIAHVRGGETGAFHAEFRLIRTNGAPAWVALRGELLTDATGRVTGAHGVAYDVDDGIALQALQANPTVFHNFAEASRDFMWIADPHTGRTTYINPAYEQVTGALRRPLEESFEYWREVVHPDDLSIAERGIGIMMAGQARELQLRIIRPDDGRVRVLDDRGFPILDENGAVRLIGGVVRGGPRRRTSSAGADRAPAEGLPRPAGRRRTRRAGHRRGAAARPGLRGGDRRRRPHRAGGPEGEPERAPAVQ